MLDDKKMKSGLMSTPPKIGDMQVMQGMKDALRKNSYNQNLKNTKENNNGYYFQKKEIAR